MTLAQLSLSAAAARAKQARMGGLGPPASPSCGVRRRRSGAPSRPRLERGENLRPHRDHSEKQGQRCQRGGLFNNDTEHHPSPPKVMIHGRGLDCSRFVLFVKRRSPGRNDRPSVGGEIKGRPVGSGRRRQRMACERMPRPRPACEPPGNGWPSMGACGPALPRSPCGERRCRRAKWEKTIREETPERRFRSPPPAGKIGAPSGSHANSTTKPSRMVTRRSMRSAKATLCVATMAAKPEA